MQGILNRNPLRLLTVFAMLMFTLTGPGREAYGQGGRPPVITGAQSLSDTGFDILSGKRVGLIANHTTLVRGVHLADLLHATPDVTLSALFGPEHGLRGTRDASEKIAHGRDDRTRAPVFSLYGKTRQPTPAMLRDIDVLIFDIQDVGARFYTFISTMGLAMQSAAKAGIPFLVLDRPNPLGGHYVAGFTTHKSNISFVSQFAIPQAHGLSVGELARMIWAEKLLPGLEGLELKVIPMKGWRRYMLWPDTGLAWRPTSPNIPDYETALIYPGSGFFEATAASEGRGTDKPFRQMGAPWANGDALAKTLNAKKLPGVAFIPAHFTPRRLPGMAANPKHDRRAVSGVEINVTDQQTFLPVETGVHVLHTFAKQARARRKRFIDRPAWLAKLSGTTRFNGMLRRGATPALIIKAWAKDVAAFKKKRAPYLLYD